MTPPDRGGVDVIVEQPIFLLGGADLEMETIRGLLDRHAPEQILDKHLKWGAKLSDYREELATLVEKGRPFVAIELADDMPIDWPGRRLMSLVDHHGDRAGADRPTALEQVFDLLDLPQAEWTRHFSLVVANDRGHIDGLRAIGATDAEVADIRAADRRAQGVTEADECEAIRAISERECRSGYDVVRTASSTSSAIADRMHAALGGPGTENFLVVMPGKLGFFGDGRIVSALANVVPDSWFGGNLPVKGFWGSSAVSEQTATSVIERSLTGSNG